jgi:hypothetical protein
MPYYWRWVNCYWFGFWTAMLYVMGVFFSAVVMGHKLQVLYSNVSSSCFSAMRDCVVSARTVHSHCDT